MRLTEKKVCYPKCDTKGNLTKIDYIEIKDKNLAEQKLYQLEDIEDELGIDLITLFKALKNGVWRYGDDIKNHLIKLFHYVEPYGKEGYGLWDEVSEVVYDFKDYGKTWALTKEELE